MQRRLLDVQGLNVSFPSGQETTVAVKDVNLQMQPGETLAIVGESGSGKSTLALSILRLTHKPSSVQALRMMFDGTDLLHLPERGMQKLRGKDISMVFQDPKTAFHPMMPLGKQLLEALPQGRRREKRQRALEMLSRVGLPDAQRQMHAYPHTLSGGMLQRVMIAMALLNQPKLLIADEPTTALDVTVQAGIIRLFARLKRQFQMGMLFISHDLGVVAQLADNVAVMRQGQIVEYGSVERILQHPVHPYTRHLLQMAPRLGGTLPMIGGR
ncbi:ABC transporter ATP-binding protein [Alicyclobacillus suci]|uniref:ABC transporter ATP-binding protein n=1 Tax=Alicyclobacillus suci TaxID=2816080 RepID=UPI001A8CFC35|nr:ABC transporter ATP-binding protein [Alicyclobacillus suci]